MSPRYQIMLPSNVSEPPAEVGWAHEAKLDGYRCVAQVNASRVRLWSRAGTEWTGRLPELDGLAKLKDVLLDGEVVVLTSDGRADFELLTSRIHGPYRAPDHDPVTLYVFDLLATGVDVRDRPWSARREMLDDLDLADRTDRAAWTSPWTAEGSAMHEATRAVGAEGTVSKRTDSPYQPGRSRRWLKAKHRIVQTIQVAGWRPSTPGRPGGLVLAENGEVIGLATLGLPEPQRIALIDLLRRYGRQHPTGTITIPEDCIQAIVHYTARTPTNGRLREAVAVAIEPAEHGNSLRSAVGS
jgi:bifunctional non-homologous end joining protein LigD